MKRLLDPLVLTCCLHTQRLASTVNANVMTVFGFPVTRKTAAAISGPWVDGSTRPTGIPGVVGTRPHPSPLGAA